MSNATNVTILRAAATLAPDDAAVIRRLGAALQACGLYAEAARTCEHLTALTPQAADAHEVLGFCRQTIGDLRGAIDSYKRALELAPASFEALHNLGTVYRLVGDLRGSIEHLQRALTIRPESPRAHYNLGLVQRELGDLPAAAGSFRRALSLRPAYPLALCEVVRCDLQLADWERLDSDRERLRAHVAEGAPISPLSLLGLTDDPHEHLCAASEFARATAQGVTPLPPAPASRSGRLRIAYLSADYHQHATAHLMAQIFELHDRSRFEVVGISFGPDDGSAMRARVRSSFDEFIDVRARSHAEVAHLLRQRAVDIAVDLKGYTGAARPQIMAHRPAPIQVNYLGYPGSSGAEFIDYIVADDFIIPPAARRYYSEQVVYLPGSYQANDRNRRIADAAPERSELGLPASGFVFCCFNKTWKIGPEIFEIWMRLLRAVPESVLWLLKGKGESESRLRTAAMRGGVVPERLIFAPTVPAPEHIARHRRADLFLDTLPYNAHTTASDALWAGLPVLTCAGRSFAARVAGSLLRAVGLPELITTSLEEYEERALALAREPAVLGGLRRKLAETRLQAPLFDSGAFCRYLEAAYEGMSRRYVLGLPPTALRVLPEPCAEAVPVEDSSELR